MFRKLDSIYHNVSDVVGTGLQNVTSAVSSGLSQSFCFFKPQEESFDGLEHISIALAQNEDEREKQRVERIQELVRQQTIALTAELAPIEQDLFKNYFNPTFTIGSLKLGTYENSRLLGAHHIERAKAVKDALLAYGVNIESKLKLIDNQISLLTGETPAYTDLPDIDAKWLTKVKNVESDPDSPGEFILELRRLRASYNNIQIPQLSLASQSLRL